MGELTTIGSRLVSGDCGAILAALLCLFLVELFWSARPDKAGSSVAVTGGVFIGPLVALTAALLGAMIYVSTRL